ncbi:hypothetical protein CAEBREN_29862 [Caenorhabditis brenneri]|uniref:Uncharacterized protein n=1 Tax=Caenorhabditis brenneri TaxID=135651 RepID=G0NJF6_CAEBE|nr:hypothetical protein CAEBREN_29862 [Caenorhabditis brenneri]
MKNQEYRERVIKITRNSLYPIVLLTDFCLTAMVLYNLNKNNATFYWIVYLIYYRNSYLILAACTFLYIPVFLVNKSRGKPTNALEICIMYHTFLMFMFKSCHIWCAWYIPIKGKPISIQMSRDFVNYILNSDNRESENLDPGKSRIQTSDHSDI